MLELAFSQTNRERLQEIVQQAPPKETPGAPYWPTEAAQSLTGVTDEKVGILVASQREQAIAMSSLAQTDRRFSFDRLAY